jgi:GTP-binding protein
MTNQTQNSENRRNNIRNVAIVAHVDHGKTTLVDGMLRQTGAFGERDKVSDRAMDSGDLEKEKGITILAKNTAIKYNGKNTPDGEEIIINVIDTPGHADFGGEVERGLSMVDGVVLLVDASEGPLPQTRFVLRKALESSLPVIIAVNKVDRPDARIEEVLDETHDLLLGLASDIIESGNADLDPDALLEAPVIYAAAKKGMASANQPENGGLPDNDDLEPLFKAIIDTVPAPISEVDGDLVAQVTNLDSSPFLGRLALVRVYRGTIKKGQQVAWVKNDDVTHDFAGANTAVSDQIKDSDGSIAGMPYVNATSDMITTQKISELLVTKGLDRESEESAGAGDIVAIAGIEDISIGDTLSAIDNPVALPPIEVDAPAISATIGINTSPLAGQVPADSAYNKKDRKVTARQIKDRLDRELIGNVSIRVLPTEKPDAWEIQVRGELALAILVEQMRREGFELTIGKPRVITQMIDGKKHEPFEVATLDLPEEYLGGVSELMAQRKGKMVTMSNHGSGWIRADFSVPTRGLIGIRTSFLTITRGTGIFASIADGLQPWAGDIETRINGSLISDRAGKSNQYAIIGLQERAKLFVAPTEEVYEGMIVGQNSRNEDMTVNITKEKKLTNMRSASADNTVTMAPPIKFTLEESLEFAGEDECIEVTPEIVRIRKVFLTEQERKKNNSKA